MRCRCSTRSGWSMKHGNHPAALHARLGRRRRGRPLEDEPAVATALGIDGRYAAAPPRALHAPAGRRREVRPDHLAVPRHARRHRPRARLGGRGGHLLPRHRPAQPAPTSRSRATTRSPSTTRCSGRRSPRGPTATASAARTPSSSTSCSLSTPSSSPGRRRATAWRGRSTTCSRTTRCRQRLAPRTYLLEDCTSPVVVPGAVDYTDEADAAFERYAAAGMHVVRSTDPIGAWPDLMRSA